MKTRLLAVALLAGAVGYLCISYVVAERFTHAARYHVDRAPQVVAPTHEDVTFRTADGLTLRGWYFDGTSDRAAIVVHGKDSNRIAGENRTGEKIADFLSPTATTSSSSTSAVTARATATGSRSATSSAATSPPRSTSWPVAECARTGSR